MRPCCRAASWRWRRQSPGRSWRHGSACGDAAAVQGCARLRRRGRRAVAVIGSYTTYRVETASLIRGLRGDARVAVAWRYRLEAAWVRAVVHRWERHAYRRADRVLVNYEAYAPSRAGATRGRSTRGAHRLRPGVGVSPAPPSRAHAGGDRGAGARHGAARGLRRPQSLAQGRGRADRRASVGAGSRRALARVPDRRRSAARREPPACDQARGLDGSVLVAGFVPDVEPSLQHADVFALPSREEQSGALAILEALRVGLPVVASAVDGIPEDVTDGDSALLVPPDDPDAMARELMRLAVDAELRKRLAAAGAQRFATRFAADRSRPRCAEPTRRSAPVRRASASGRSRCRPAPGPSPPR